MKADKKADRATRKEERSGNRDGVEKEKRAEIRREAVVLVCSGVNVVRDWRGETHWGRRVRSSTRKHKYLIEARLTGEQKAQSASPRNKVFFPTDHSGGLGRSVLLYVLYVYYIVLYGRSWTQNVVYNRIRAQTYTTVYLEIRPYQRAGDILSERKTDFWDEAIMNI